MLLLLTWQCLVIGSLPLQLDWLCTAPHLAPKADRLPLAHSSNPGLHRDDRSLASHCTERWKLVTAHTHTHTHARTLWTFRQVWVTYSVNKWNPEANSLSKHSEWAKVLLDDKAKKENEHKTCKVLSNSVKDVFLFDMMCHVWHERNSKIFSLW